ncbi:MAG: aminotransferase class III-fold pyridoxal phosphate-dependent enzyme [Pseudomonadales bacterium]|nr:aminotransferase class III-fold pyridoxal phosphate-dependent enzyme [Pseudomonadales bacterium]NIX07438.1 aminotransferase class III-fold pyridoxal phosphate-dependent enzyme [Pseudomonadales bacterium]
MAASMTNLHRSAQLYERARAVIPGGIPGIRAPENFVPGAYPILLAGGRGGHVTDVDGNDYVDLLLGYGPVILGHAEGRVDAAARERAAGGFCLDLPEPIMIELAERLVSMVPSAEQVLLLKTGSDATTAAIRIARTYTGRSIVLRCGYHGWHDWCLEGDPGVPSGTTDTVIPFPYNDLDRLAHLLKNHAGDVAAIMLTPVGHDFDRQIEPPGPGFLEGVRKLADEHAVVLAFDEVRTGFRVHPGGAQGLYGVTPDLTALGKAMSNGYPVTALVGRREVMESAQNTFISSTYFPNGMEMAAALKTLELIVEEDVLSTIGAIGASLREGLGEIVTRHGLPVSLSPFDEMPFVYFKPALESRQIERRDAFYGALAQDGVFAHPRHHGFLCWRHGAEDLARVLEAVDAAAAGL